MAKRKDNWAWVKVNTPSLSASFQGPTLACVRELFLMLPLEQHERALELLAADSAKRKQRHAEAAGAAQHPAEVPA